ncbi:MAG TPA: HDIG domain-containing protein [Polyangia bacterium]|jgi:putative nucleotidyltransferase with HDIG domain
MTHVPAREEALALLHEYTQTESLRHHALSVEASMRAFARARGEDEDLYGAVGLLHDMDYERWPDPAAHTLHAAEIIRARGWAEALVLAVLGHNEKAPRDTLLARALVALDELSGFVVACALVRPGKNVGTLEPRSVLKKMKDKAFARQVDREGIRRGAEELGVPLEELCALVIGAQRGIAPTLGLSTDAPPAV